MNKFKDFLSKDKKTSNLILIAILLVILLISTNYIFNNDKKEEKVIDKVSENTKSNIEDKLSNIISKIDGINSASVLITYSSSEKKIPVYDTKENIDSVTESSKTSSKKTVEKTVAYEGNSALIESKEEAKACGAIVVISGNITEVKKGEIKDAVSYTTGVPIHKIQVFVN